MTKLTETQKRQVLTEDALYTDIIGQMRGNIERMEREGTTNAPPLDASSRDNAGKTQYQIDNEILISYSNLKAKSRKQNQECFEIE